jgi:UDP-glucose-4-epimerase GalE
MARIFVTGGAGYVGSHTCKRLSRAGHKVAVYDDLSRGHREFVKWGQLFEGKLQEGEKLRNSLREFAPEAVMHFAACAYVGESVRDPHLYYSNNVCGTLLLLWAMREVGIPRLVFSSSCATYGQPERMPITEDTPQRPINPYGASKVMAEQICRDFEKAHGIKFVALRYFNACGADLEGEIGERHDPEPHLIPRTLMAADGRLEAFDIYGDDYPTPDGTCVRDFVHVDDLADAHIMAAEYLAKQGVSSEFNIGSGQGHSVREVIRTVEEVTGKSIPQRMAPRRDGDPPVLVADISKARRILKWKPHASDLRTIVSTAWNWYCKERNET